MLITQKFYHLIIAMHTLNIFCQCLDIDFFKLFDLPQIVICLGFSQKLGDNRFYKESWKSFDINVISSCFVAGILHEVTKLLFVTNKAENSGYTKSRLKIKRLQFSILIFDWHHDSQLILEILSSCLDHIFWNCFLKFNKSIFI